MARRKQLTAEEKAERRAAKKAKADAAQAAAVEALKHPDAWRVYLAGDAVAAKYSLRNQMLIYMQCPGATDCAGYVDWQKRGRQVRKMEEGESGILIFGPRTRKVDSDGNPTEPGDPNGESRMCGVTYVTTFDISMTDPIEGREFIPPTVGDRPDPAAVRELIPKIAGEEHAAAVLAAFDQAAGLVPA